MCSKDSMLGKSIKATGGGAYKFAELIQQKLGFMWVYVLVLCYCSILLFLYSFNPLYYYMFFLLCCVYDYVLFSYFLFKYFLEANFLSFFFFTSFSLHC